MADTYVATSKLRVGTMVFKKGDVVPWSLIGSTGVLKRLLSKKAVRRVPAK